MSYDLNTMHEEYYKSHFIFIEHCDDALKNNYQYSIFFNHHIIFSGFGNSVDNCIASAKDKIDFPSQ